MKKIISAVALALTLLTPAIASAQLSVPQGGTGRSSFTGGDFIYADSNSFQRLTGTSSPFFTRFTFGTATGTSATTTSLYSTLGNFLNLCINSDCRTSWPAGGTVTSVAATVPTGWQISGSPVTTSGTLAFTYASGYQAMLTASSSNWNSFYDTPSTRITDGLGLTWSSNTLNCDTASGSVFGCLASADWTTFNNKQAAGNYITALTGDVTASGPGSVAATLATVNSNIGSFTNASITVNGKGLITAASSGSASVTVVSTTTVQNLATTTLRTSDGTLPSGYNNYRITFIDPKSSGSGATTTTNFLMAFNGDLTAIYTYRRFEDNVTTDTSANFKNVLIQQGVGQGRWQKYFDIHINNPLGAPKTGDFSSYAYGTTTVQVDASVSTGNFFYASTPRITQVDIWNQLTQSFFGTSTQIQVEAW